MNRRQYLSGVVVGATPLVAGCSAGDDTSDSEDSQEVEQNPAESAVFDEHIRPHTSAAMDAFEKAVGLLQTAAGTFDSLEPGGVDHQTSQTVSEVNSHLADAQDQLGTASNAGYSHLFTWYISGMQEYRAWLAKLVPFLERAANSHNEWVSVHSMWPPQDYENIRGNLGVVTNARGIEHFPTWEPPEDTTEQLDRFDLEEFQQLDSWSAEIEDSFSTLAEWGQTLRTTGSGVSTVAQGFPWYLEAVTRYENQQYEGGNNEVAGRARPALGQFEEALAHFEENTDSIPSQYETTYSEYVCFAESMVEAAELLLEASRAAADGDMETAQTKTRESESARNHCPLTESR